MTHLYMHYSYYQMNLHLKNIMLYMEKRYVL